MNLLHPTACDFMVHKHYKNRFLRFIFPVCRINFRIQHLTCPLISLYHHPSQYFFAAPLMQVSSSYLPSAFDHIHADQWLTAFKVHLGAPCRGGVSQLKIISLYFLIVPLMVSSSSSFVFVRFRQGIFNFFASPNSNVLLLVL